MTPDTRTDAASETRRRATPNRSGEKIRDAYRLLIEGHLSQLWVDLDQLEAKDRVAAIIQLSEYVLPKRQQVAKEIDAAKMTDAELEQFIDCILDRIDRRKM